MHRQKGGSQKRFRYSTKTGEVKGREEERESDKEMTAIEMGLNEDLTEAKALIERVKDSDNPKLKEHARFAVKLGEDAKEKTDAARTHRAWNPTSEKLVKDAKQYNTGCRENIRKAKRILEGGGK